MTDTTSYGEVTWEYYSLPPEMVVAETELGPIYFYDCVGTVPASENELVKVFVPHNVTPENSEIIELLEENFGRYAESLADAREMDGFTESDTNHLLKQ